MGKQNELTHLIGGSVRTKRHMYFLIESRFFKAILKKNEGWQYDSLRLSIE